MAKSVHLLPYSEAYHEQMGPIPSYLFSSSKVSGESAENSAKNKGSWEKALF